MAEIIPADNLPPQSRNWGQKITFLIRQLLTRTDKLEQDAFNNNRQLSGSVNTLAEQINLLNAQAVSYFAEFGSFRSSITGWDTAAPGEQFVAPTSRIKVTISGAANGGSVTYTYAIRNVSTGEWIQSKENALAEGSGIRTLDLSGGANYINSGSRTWVVENIPVGDTISVFAMSYHQDQYASSFYKSVLVEILP